MNTPNTALKAARLGARLSQDELARALRAQGCASASKRLVQRWEAGQTRVPHAAHARALEKVMGLPITTLGFGPVGAAELLAAEGQAPDPDDVPVRPLPGATPGGGRGGHGSGDAAALYRAAGTLNGVWRSVYEYPSTGRAAVFSGRHHVVVLQHGDTVSVRSLPGSAGSRMSMDLKLSGGVLTGTWVENTDPEGYYAGATYHGAIQLLVEPSGRRLAGKWIGFGSNFDVNVGPWVLTLLDQDTSRAGIDRWNRRPDAE